MGGEGAVAVDEERDGGDGRLDGAVVLLDLDETVYQYVDAVRSHLAAIGRTAPNGTPAPLLEEPQYYSFAQSGWFDSEDAYRRAHLDATNRGMHLLMRPYPRALAAIERMRLMGAAVHVATARAHAVRNACARLGATGAEAERLERTAVRETLAALRRDGLDGGRILFEEDKARVAVALDCDYVIDDAAHVLESLANCSGGGVRAVAVRPVRQWNRAAPCGLSFEDWGDAPDMIADHWARGGTRALTGVAEPQWGERACAHGQRGVANRTASTAVDNR